LPTPQPTRSPTRSPTRHPTTSPTSLDEALAAVDAAKRAVTDSIDKQEEHDKDMPSLQNKHPPPHSYSVRGPCRVTTCTGGVDSGGYMLKPHVHRSPSEPYVYDCGWDGQRCKCSCWSEPKPKSALTPASAGIGLTVQVSPPSECALQDCSHSLCQAYSCKEIGCQVLPSDIAVPCHCHSDCEKTLW
jgi:hypothetical protein